MIQIIYCLYINSTLVLWYLMFLLLNSFNCNCLLLFNECSSKCGPGFPGFFVDIMSVKLILEHKNSFWSFLKILIFCDFKKKISKNEKIRKNENFQKDDKYEFLCSKITLTDIISTKNIKIRKQGKPKYI